ncbi:tetratricopeptide repeat protein [Moheibacter stercoris]|uniref:Tetratricopeptide repeat-containing protein n=1 Tax=Moheibacter stercoris TaxID=1628251 RepID=A0ABV2LUV2_9FLAO
MKLGSIISTFILLTLVAFLLIQCKKENKIGQSSNKNLVEFNEDSLQLKKQHEKGKKFLSDLNYDSLIQADTKQIRDANLKNNKYYSASAYFRIGNVHMREMRENLAHSYFEKALQDFKSLGDTTMVVRTLRQLAMMYAEFGDFNYADQYLHEASKYVPKNDKDSLKNFIQLTYGYFATLQKDNQRAIEWFEKVAKDSLSFHNYTVAKSNIAHIRSEDQEFDKAEKIYEELFGIIKLKEDSSFYSYLMNAKQSMLLQKQSDMVDSSQILEALKIRKIIKNNIGILQSLETLTRYYLSQNNTKMAIETGNELLRLAKIHNSNRYLQLAYDHLIRIENPKKAKQYTLEFIAYKDQLELAQNEKTNSFSRSAYELELNKHENELLLIQSKAEKEKILFSRLYLILLIVGILAFIFYIFHYSKLQKIKHENFLFEQISQTEKNISEKVSKEISKGLDKIINYIETYLTEENPSNKELLLKRMQKVYRMSRNISRENSFFMHSNNFGIELQKLIHSHQTEKVSINVNPFRFKHWKKINLDKRIDIYKAVDEFLTSMKKPNDVSEMDIFIEINKFEMKINYNDNGFISEPNRKLDLSGLNLFTNRIQKLKGEWMMDKNSQNGTHITIKIPLNSSEF